MMCGTMYRFVFFVMMRYIGCGTCYVIGGGGVRYMVQNKYLFHSSSATHVFVLAQRPGLAQGHGQVLSLFVHLVVLHPSGEGSWGDR